MPGASHLTVTHDARPGRILRAAPQVMSLHREHDSNSERHRVAPERPSSAAGAAGTTLTLQRQIAVPVCLYVSFHSRLWAGEYPQQGSREEVFRSAEVHLLLQIDPSASDPELVTS